MKIFVVFNLLLFSLIGCSNQNDHLIENQPPEFELSIMNSGDSLSNPTLLEKTGLSIETDHWDTEEGTLTDEEVLSTAMSLREEHVNLQPYEVILDRYLINFDFSKAEDKPNYFFAFITSDEEEALYWEGEIPDDGVFTFSPPYTGIGIVKVKIIFQWQQTESVVLGQQTVRFDLNVSN